MEFVCRCVCQKSNDFFFDPDPLLWVKSCLGHVETFQLQYCEWPLGETGNQAE